MQGQHQSSIAHSEVLPGGLSGVCASFSLRGFPKKDSHNKCSLLCMLWIVVNNRNMMEYEFWKSNIGHFERTLTARRNHRKRGQTVVNEVPKKGALWTFKQALTAKSQVYVPRMSSQLLPSFTNLTSLAIEVWEVNLFLQLLFHGCSCFLHIVS